MHCTTMLLQAILALVSLQTLTTAKVKNDKATEPKIRFFNQLHLTVTADVKFILAVVDKSKLANII